MIASFEDMEEEIVLDDEEDCEDDLEEEDSDSKDNLDIKFLTEIKKQIAELLFLSENKYINTLINIFVMIS